MNKILMLIFSIVIIVSSCYNDSEEGLFPQNVIDAQCDTTVFTFSLAIKPMIDANCITCHKTQSPVLKTFDDVSLNATRILGSIKHQSGYIAMPQGSSVLESCKITQFEKWMTTGKKNN
jgi:hypothetical protein